MVRRGVCEDCDGPCPTWQDVCYACQDLRNQRAKIIGKRLRGHRYSHDEEEGTFLYAVGVIGDCESPVKFGSSNDPMQRLSDIQCGCPYPLEVLAQIRARRGIERLIHRYLHVTRLHGEWFGRTEKSDQVIELMRAGDAENLLATVRIRPQRRINDLTEQSAE